MENTVQKIEKSFEIVQQLIDHTAREVLEFKVAPKQWSMKEILGHLCDSAIHNLQRFVEVQYEPKPYKVRDYNQVELVVANNYQHLHTEQILNLWLALNKQIISLIKSQTSETFQYEIITCDGKSKILKWLMEDYALHLEHHIQQMIKLGDFVAF